MSIKKIIVGKTYMNFFSDFKFSFSFKWNFYLSIINVGYGYF
jgi:hypothetical protein